MNLTREQLNELLNKPAIGHRNPQLQNPVAKSDFIQRERSLQHSPQVVPGAAQSKNRSLVCIESHRARLCDPDNLYVKALVDAIRYAGLITDDSPEHIDLTVRQFKCKRADEKTVIQITQ